MQRFFPVIFLLPLFANAQSPVTLSAGFGENIPSLACLACVGTEWSNPMSITAEDDSVAFTVLNPAGNCFQSICCHSRYLFAHHFNFDIPADATIDSIFVDIKRSALTADAVRDSIVQLEKSDSLVGDNLSSPGFWPTAPNYEIYGHNSPLWGTTWLPSDINDTTFGVSLRILNITSSEVQAGVDHIQMIVYYSTTNRTHSVTSTPSEITWINSPGQIEMNIFTPLSVNCSSKIFNAKGQEVISFNYGQSLTGQNHFQCSTDLLVPGIYFFIMNAGGKFYSRKFLVMN